MSINSAMRSGVTGLAAQSSRMAAISDNISNANTVGYKRTGVQFSTLVTRQSGSSSYSAGGVIANARMEISKQGLIQAASATTDLAIAGGGFFVVSNKPGVMGEATFGLTRAGSFRTDAEGFLVNTAGQYLQGWPIAADGSVGSVSRESFADLRPVNLAGSTAAGQPTTYLNFTGNVPADSTGPGAPTVPFKTSVEYYTPLGKSDRLFLEWQPSTTPNTWTINITDSTGTSFGSVDVEFNDSGAYAGSPATYSNIVVGIPGFNFDPATGRATLEIPNGTTPQTITIDFGAPNSFSGVTQFAGDYDPRIHKDGAAVGILSRVEVSEDGILYGVYDNGSRRALWQIPLADVPNPDGLIAEDGNVFSLSGASGSARLVDANSGAVGAIAGGALEGSNVDIATELTDLIETQRAYSTNAKIVQTADEMLEVTTQLKR